MIITFDGPAASGKSTVARKVAEKLGIYYLNTGLIYRTLAYVLVHQYNYSLEQLAMPQAELIEAIFFKEHFSYCYSPETKEHVFVNNQDITKYLKTPDIDRYASIVSAHAMVRSYVLEYQRSFARQYDLVADGRDLGSRVFPYAEYKFFLTASLKVRAERWQKDQERRGFVVSLQDSEKEIALRDERDSSRVHAPLIVPPDAIVIDTSNSTIDQTVAIVLEKICSDDNLPKKG